VVTGASRGIGAAIAAALRTAGARVIRAARSLADGRHEGYDDLRCDVSDAASVEALARRVRDEHGVPEIVVSNAGAFILKPLEQTTPAELDGQIGANLRGPFSVARAFLPRMRDAGRGAFITLGSIADYVAFPENTAYAASKFGLRGLHEVLRAELTGTGVRSTLVSPGPVDTAMWDALDPDSRPGFTPRARMLQPEAVAAAVVFAIEQPAEVNVDEIRIARS